MQSDSRAERTDFLIVLIHDLRLYQISSVKNRISREERFLLGDLDTEVTVRRPGAASFTKTVSREKLGICQKFGVWRALAVDALARGNGKSMKKLLVIPR